MTIDDVAAISGDYVDGKKPLWHGAPLFAMVDLPFAAALDTGFLPIALIVWGIKSASGADDEDHSHGRAD